MAHPLSLFRFCPVCGSADFHEHDDKSKTCGHCGFEYYLNPSAANAAFILNERGELLVVTRAKEPAKGTLDLPGGFADIGETAEEGVAREVFEETSLVVRRLQYLFSYPNVYLYSGFEVKTLDAFYLCEVEDSSQVSIRDDAAAFRWIALDDIRLEQFGLRSVRRAVADFLGGRNRAQVFTR